MTKLMDFIITGPTASGKSDFAHKLARRIGGVIINCDSVQIYRGIENISASPLAHTNMVDGSIDGVPYMLFSVLGLNAQISVVDYQRMANDAYNAAHAMARPAIFVGGTGYYINAIVDGVSPMPEISADVRERARALVRDDFAAARELAGADFGATDPQRVARAAEVFLQTGRHITEFQSMPRVGAFLQNARRILINPPVDVLCERIAARIPQMIDNGALGEARAAINNNLDTGRAIGLGQLCAYLRGEITRDECIRNWVIKTNQYAKRQRTWFRTQFNPDITINRVPGDADVDAVIGDLI